MGGCGAGHTEHCLGNIKNLSTESSRTARLEARVALLEIQLNTLDRKVSKVARQIDHLESVVLKILLREIG